MTIRRPTKDELDRVLALTQQAFNIPTAAQQRRRERVKLDQLRVIDDGSDIKATARAIPLGHWFGGRLVRATGISGVAVAAEARGKGSGRALMERILQDLRADGIPISSLYPATVPLYRSLGYGYGGIRTSWKVALDALPAERGPDLEAFDVGATDELNDVYAGLARATNGLIDRDADWWRDIVEDVDGEEPRYRYLVREDGAVTGWTVYKLASTKDSWRSTLQCRDLFWSTPTAGRALLAFAALHRSTSVEMTWVGPTSDPLGDLTREDVVEHDGSFRYMVRLLDVPAAFEARGYPAGLETEVTLAVEDPLFHQNAGPWRVQVSGGGAKVSQAEHADARADVQTWASLWTGLRDARAAVRIGALEASEHALAALDAMFAGPTPWIADFY